MDSKITKRFIDDENKITYFNKIIGWIRKILKRLSMIKTKQWILFKSVDGLEKIKKKDYQWQKQK